MEEDCILELGRRWSRKAFELPLRHLGGGGDGYSNMELKGEIGVEVIVAMIIVQMLFISHDGTD